MKNDTYDEDEIDRVVLHLLPVEASVDQPSISGQRLAGGDDSVVLEKPPYSYLDPEEVVQFLFHNEHKGYAVGSKTSAVTPDGDSTCLCLVTDSAVHLLCGKEDGDKHRRVPLNKIREVEVSTGMRKTRLTVSTTDGQQYHHWQNAANYDREQISAVAGYVRDRQSIPTLDVSFVDASSGTVTAERLTNRSSDVKPVNARPIDLLSDDEQPHFVFHNDSKGHKVGDETKAPASQYGSLCIVTDENVHFITGGKAADEYDSVPMHAIDMAEFNVGLSKFRFSVDSADGTIYSHWQSSTEYACSTLGAATEFVRSTANDATPPPPGSESADSPRGTGPDTSPARTTGESSVSLQNQDDATLRARLQRIDPYEFESFVADLFKEMGYDTHVTSSSNDRGIDIVAERKKPFEQRLVIQAKRYNDDNKIGSKDVREYATLRQQEDDVDAVFIVTSGTVTTQAQKLASDLKLKWFDGTDLVDLVDEYDAYDLLASYLDASPVER
jgi:hypothetical protein